MLVLVLVLVLVLATYLIHALPLSTCHRVMFKRNPHKSRNTAFRPSTDLEERCAVSDLSKSLPLPLTRSGHADHDILRADHDIGYR